MPIVAILVFFVTRFTKNILGPVFPHWHKAPKEFFSVGDPETPLPSP